MTQERVVKMVLGDWSGDGHGVTKTLILKLKGEDVSDKALEKSRKRAQEVTGVDLSGLFTRDGVSYLDGDDLKAIMLAGIDCFVLSGDDNYYVPGYYVKEKELERLKKDEELSARGDKLAIVEESLEYEGLSSVALIMGFLLYGNEGVTYEPIEIEAIVGDYGAPLSGFGYGHYYP